MAGFLYYFPGCKTPCSSGRYDQLPPECELTHLQGSTWTTLEIMSYLDGSRGPVIAIHAGDKHGKEASAGYFDKPDKQNPRPDTQVWRKCYDVNKNLTHYLGYEIANPPQPQDLLRQKPVTGYFVELNDLTWVVPAVAARYSTLPKVWDMGIDGWFQQPLSEYAAIVEEARTFFEYTYLNESTKTNADVLQFATKLMGLNYRIGFHEAAALGLYRTDAVNKIIEAGMGVPEMLAQIEASKKKETL